MNGSALRFLLLFCVPLLVGCAASGPDGTAVSTDARTTPVSDSTRRGVDPQDERAAAEQNDALLSALRTAYVNGEYEEVVRRARERLRDSLRGRTAIQLYTLLGRAEQARGRHEAAIRAIRKARVRAVERDQSVVRLDRALGESYAALYRWPRAASAFRRVLDAHPGDRAIRQALAEVYRQARSWDDAQWQYARLVRQDSTNGEWWAKLAKCELELDRVRKARRHFARAHQLLPQSADVALTLSRLYRAAKQPGVARSVIDTTLSYQSGDPRLWRRRADLAFEQNDLETARRAYTQTMAVGDSSATALRRIGLIEVKQERYAKALSPLRKSFRRNARHPRTTLYLGISYLKVDSLKKATTYLQKTIDRETEGPIMEALRQLGTASNQRGDVRRAVRAYRAALRLQPDRTELYFRLATVYDEHYEEKATAARYYRRFLRASDSTEATLRGYAENRLDELRPILHMQEGVSQASDTSREQ